MDKNTILEFDSESLFVEGTNRTVYNEAFIADLRRRVLAAGAEGARVLLSVSRVSRGTDERLEAALAHCRRRLKNCAALAGWKQQFLAE
ncbi:MAG: hypothetical protein LBJ31_05695 [Treponema sp.]|nr:hypothetical protein [Treponema sp.]